MSFFTIFTAIFFPLIRTPKHYIYIFYPNTLENKMAIVAILSVTPYLRSGLTSALFGEKIADMIWM